MSASHRLNRSVRGDYFVLVGPYDPKLVDALKEAVPAHAREWRPVAKCWRISNEYEDVVRGLLG